MSNLLRRDWFRIKSRSRCLSVSEIYKQNTEWISGLFSNRRWSESKYPTVNPINVLNSKNFSILTRTYRYWQHQKWQQRWLLKNTTMPAYLAHLGTCIPAIHTAVIHRPLAIYTPACYQSLPCARCAARSIICSSFTAKPVAIKIGRGMVDCEALLVALANFGEYINPVLGLHTVVCLNIQDSSFRLDHLEHLQTQK